MTAAVAEQPTRTYPYITTTSGGSGFFAVMIWLNPDMGGFEEPWQTGIGRYKSSAQAAIEAREWAAAEELEYVE